MVIPPPSMCLPLFWDAQTYSELLSQPGPGLAWRLRGGAGVLPEDPV